MGRYQHVLVAVDLTDEAPQVLKRAEQIAQEQNAKLSVMTVIQPISYAYAGLDAGWISKEMANFETDSKRFAETGLAKLAAAIGVNAGDTHVAFGAPAVTIKDQAEEMGVDLIVLGTHGRHGLGRILGSTANGVLHGVQCDVLAVRIEPEA
jgi:universal stress protein A